MQDFQQQEEENKEKSSVVRKIFMKILIIFSVLTIILCAFMLWFMPNFNNHLNDSKLRFANSYASYISNSAKLTLSYMDDNEYFIGGTHVLCSERERNITDGKFDEDIFYEYIDEYFSDVRFKWFVVIEEGKTTYSAAQSENQKTTGSYPYKAVKSRGPAFYDGTYKNKKADLDDLYKYVRDNLNK